MRKGIKGVTKVVELGNPLEGLVISEEDLSEAVKEKDEYFTQRKQECENVGGSLDVKKHIGYEDFGASSRNLGIPKIGWRCGYCKFYGVRTLTILEQESWENRMNMIIY